MKVTIAVPIYNAAPYLKQSISAVLNQTHRDLEILLIVNGSTDSSLEICNSFAAEDERITVFNIEEKIGSGAARNIGIEKATGEYICFFDADDWFESDTVEKFIEKSGGADVTLCSYVGFRDGISAEEFHDFGDHKFESSRDVREYFATWFPDGRVGFVGNKFYKLSVIKENSLAFKTYPRLQDGFFNLEFFACANSCVVLSDRLYHYRLSPASLVISKINSGYADLVFAMTDAALGARKNWGLETPTDEVYKFCLNELGTSVENAFVGNWGMNAQTRQDYLKQLTLTDTYRDAYEHLDLIGGYRRTLHKLLHAQRFTLLGLLVRIKTFGKGNLQWIYYRLKK